MAKRKILNHVAPSMNQSIKNAVIPQKVREQKVQEVKFHISLLGLNDQQHKEIKRLFIILNLWEKFNRSHTEIIDLPFIQNKSIEVKLFNSSKLESKVVLKYNK